MGEVVKVKVGKGTFWHFQDRFGSKYIPELAMYQQRTLLNSIVVRVTHYKQKKIQYNNLSRWDKQKILWRKY